MDITIINGRVLLPDGTLTEAAVGIEDGCVATVTDTPPTNGARFWDAGGGLVLPGMVDLHGDAFERQLMPRPEAPFPVDMALMETDRQLIANGITTAYYGITYSWEPGLRGRGHVVAIMDTMEALRTRFHCDTRVHMRWELFNLAAEDEVAAWLAGGRIDLLAATAREHGIVMASHDDETPEMRRRYNGVGCTLCEFPLDRATADASNELGDPIILGAPNVVRDGSHCDRLHAATSVSEGRCHILTSDYFYPSMLQAVFILIDRGHADLATAWRLVSTTPAKAAGLGDRGEIAAGRRADIVVIDDSHPGLPRVKGTFVAGRAIHSGH